MIVLEQPMLPYNGTSGWSGSDTSAARAERNDSNGTTARQQNEVLRILDAFGGYGVTWKELAGMTGWHHGTASGNLSILHKAGRIARLTTTRQRCKVYVLPEYAVDRPTEPHGSHKHSAPARQVLTHEEVERITEAISGQCFGDRYWCDRHHSYWPAKRACNQFLTDWEFAERILAEVGIEVRS